MFDIISVNGGMRTLKSENEEWARKGDSKVKIRPRTAHPVALKNPFLTVIAQREVRFVPKR